MSSDSIRAVQNTSTSDEAMPGWQIALLVSVVLIVLFATIVPLSWLLTHFTGLDTLPGVAYKAYAGTAGTIIQLTVGLVLCAASVYFAFSKTNGSGRVCILLTLLNLPGLVYYFAHVG